MELKRLIANDSKSALQSVRDECGDDALIVSTNKVGKKTEVIYIVIRREGFERSFSKTQADTARFSDAQAIKKSKTMKTPMSEISRQIQSWEH